MHHFLIDRANNREIGRQVARFAPQIFEQDKGILLGKRQIPLSLRQLFQIEQGTRRFLEDELEPLGLQHFLQRLPRPFIHTARARGKQGQGCGRWC